MLRLKRLLIENSGPIERFDARFESTDAGLPKPMILVGENGSGKSTALSFAVDSLLQLASTQFSDVLRPEGMGTLFYRIRSNDIRIGASTSVAHIEYEFSGRTLHYLDRAAGTTIDVNDLRQRLGLPAEFPLNGAKTSEKTWSQNLDQVKATFSDDAYVFFPSGRREIPHWLQVRALHPERFSNTQRFTSKLGKALVVESAAEEMATWIMDGLLDQAVGYQGAGIEAANQILQIILGDPTAHFAIAPRNTWPRVQIYTGVSNDVDGSNPRRMAIPSLGHLSAGQSMLLSMFGTIANHGTLNRMRPLNEIEGLAIIDEAEVYLHTHLQRLVLPRLISAFPNVQFVITTHSPSFLMGMKDQFGPDEFQLLEMPTGMAIDVDQFSEVGAAVEALTQTLAFRNEVKAEITRALDNPILIVEGRSDAIWIDGLWRISMNSVPPFRIMTAKGRRALRYLLEDEQFVSEVGAHQRVLGLFDFDEAYDDWNGCNKTYPNLEGNDASGLLRRHVAKSIYAGLLPVPGTREKQAGNRFGAKSIHTIELYLPDERLSCGQNLESIALPGDVQVSKFRGDRVTFAERAVVLPDVAPYFDTLLTMIQQVLQV